MKKVFLSILFSLLAVSLSYGTTHIYWVTNTSDYNGGTPIANSLRWAVETSNANPGDNYIKFAIPGSGKHIIPLIGFWIDITTKVIIDGTTQDLTRDYTQQDPLIVVMTVGTPYYFGNIFNLLYDAGSSFDASGTQIKAITLSGDGGGGDITAIYLYGPPTTSSTAIENVTIENCMFNTLDLPIFLESCSNVQIRGCYLGLDHSLALSIPVGGFYPISTMVGDGIWAFRQHGNLPPIHDVQIGGPGAYANYLQRIYDGVGIDLYEANQNGPDIYHFLISRNLFLGPVPVIYKNIELNDGLSYGANDYIQPPTITNVDASTRTIYGTAGHNYKIEVFRSNFPELTDKYLGYSMSDNSGNWSFSGITLPITESFLATATDSVNNTSEFSNVGLTTKPIISASPDCGDSDVVLSVNSAYDSFQWYKNSTILTGETNNTYTATAPGTYYCIVTIAGLGGTYISYSFVMV